MSVADEIAERIGLQRGDTWETCLRKLMRHIYLLEARIVMLERKK